ncbi:MAG: helix-turn-helix transcriptional regulator [Thermoguttaceae bacterium]
MPRITLTPTGDASPALLDVQSVAALLGCSPRHIYRLADAGKMPKPVKLGSLSRWSNAAIAEWIANGCKPVRSTPPKSQSSRQLHFNF